MATEPKARTRKARTSPEMAKLIQYCRISILVIGELSQHAVDPMKQFFNGQSDALKAVLRQLGATEAE